MIWLSRAAQDQIEAAQRELALHLSGMMGRCLTCRVEAPCAPRVRAERTLANYGKLPRRSRP